jgi:hypothetical protein
MQVSTLSNPYGDMEKLLDPRQPVEEFLEQLDLLAYAANAVLIGYNKHDLLNMSVEQLQAELRMAPAHARRIAGFVNHLLNIPASMGAAAGNQAGD